MHTIRTATVADLKAIHEIINHNILYSNAVYDYDPKTFTEIEQWYSDKLAGNWPVLVAESEGVIAGYASYGTFRFKEGFKFTVEHSVYVADAQHGKGIGQLLLSELIAIAKNRGYHTMIGCIDADNGGSIAFHKKFGFIEAGVLKQSGFKFGRWLDLLFMQLIIN